MSRLGCHNLAQNRVRINMAGESGFLTIELLLYGFLCISVLTRYKRGSCDQSNGD